MSDIVFPTASSRNLINQLIKEHNFDNVDICITSGSEKGDNYSGEIYRIKIVSKLNGCDLLNLILKSKSQNEANREVIPLSTIYAREAVVYNEILPAFEIFQKKHNISDQDCFTYAKCYKANDELLLMEDLGAKGFKMHNRFNSLDENHLKLVITSLASFHAISFAIKEKQTDSLEYFIKLVEKSVVAEFFHPMLEGVIPKTICILKDETKIEKLRKFSVDIVSKYYAYTGPSMKYPYNVICHGDCWNNNLLFRYENDVPVEVIFLDWQVCRYGSPVSDLSNLIYCSTDKNNRDKFGSKIFDVYYDALASQLQKFECNIEKSYPRDVFQNHIKEFLPYGLLMGLIAIPIVLTQKGNELDLSEMMNYDISENSKIQYNSNSIERVEDIIDEFISYKLI